MTIEELFIEEYKNLKEKNELLNEQINSLRRASENICDNYRKICDFLYSLKLRIRKNDYDGKKFITSGNGAIFEGDEYYNLASKFAKEDEHKEEDEK